MNTQVSSMQVSIQVMLKQISQPLSRLEDFERYDKLEKQGKYEEALRLYNEVKEFLDPEDPDALSARNNIAGILLKQGKYNEALQIYEDVYEIRKRLLDPRDIYTLTTFHNIAGALVKQGKYEKALGIYHQVYREIKEVLGPEHPDTLTTRNNIAVILYNQGKYDEALKVFQEVYKKKLEVLGPNHPDTLNTSDGIASVLGGQGKYDKALQVYQEVYEKRLEVLGPDHQDTLTTRNNMAGVLHNQNKYDEALQVYQEVYEKRLEVLGPEHPNTLMTYNDIAAIYLKQEKYEEALKIFNEVYEIQKRPEVLGPKHPVTLATRNNMASSLLEQGKYDEALKVFQEVYKKKLEVLGSEHPETLVTLNNISGVLYKQGKYDEALKVFQEVYEKRLEVLGPEHPGTLDTKQAIGMLKMCITLEYAKQLNPIKSNDFVNAKTANKGKTALHVAAEKGNLHVVKLLLKNGAVYNAKNKDNKTPSELTTDNRIKYLFNLVGKLFENVKKGDNQQVVQCLKKEKAIVNARDNDGGGTPLYWAIHNDHMNTARLLLENGADPSLVTNKGNIPLHIASSKGNNDIVRLLLENVKPDKLNNFINAQTTVGKTSALHIASNIEVIRSLLQYGAVYNIKNKEGKTPFDLAKNDDIRKLLSFTNELFEDAKNGNHDIIGKLDNLKVDDFIAVTNARNDQGHTLLQVAIANKHRDVATELSKILRKGQSSRMESIDIEGSSSRRFGNLSDSVVEPTSGSIELQSSTIVVPFNIGISRGRDTVSKPFPKLGLEEIELEEHVCDTQKLFIKAINDNNVDEIMRLSESLNPLEPIDDKNSTQLHYAAAHLTKTNLEKFLKLIQEKVGADELQSLVNKQTSGGTTPLHIAVKRSLQNSKNLPIIDVLMRYNPSCNIRDKDGKTPIGLAREKNNREIVDFIEQRQPQISTGIGTLSGRDTVSKLELEEHVYEELNIKDDIGETALHKAARNGDIDEVQKLLEKGADVNIRNDHGETALHEAARKGHKEVVELLLKESYKFIKIKNDVINDRTAFGDTALHNAAINDNQDLVQLLLDKGANINSRNVRSETPLYLASSLGKEKVVRLLLCRKADIEARNYKGNTSLHIAAENRKEKIVELLLASGANANSRNSRRETPLHLASNKIVVRSLLDYGADISAKTSEISLHRYAQMGDIDRIEEFLKKAREENKFKESVNHEDDNGIQPIHLAAREGHKDAVEFLLKEGAMSNAQDKSGIQPIHLAAMEGHKNVVELLLNKDKNLIEARDKSGMQAIHLAAREGHRNVVGFLLNKDKNLINSQASSGITPIHLAARNLHMDVINLLISREADVDITDRLEQKFVNHFASGLYNGYKKLVRGVIAFIAESEASLPSDKLLEKQALLPELKSALNFKDKLFTELEKQELTNMKMKINGLDIILDSYKTLERLCESIKDIDDVQKQVLKSVDQITKYRGSNHEFKNDLCFPKFLLDVLRVGLLRFKYFSEVKRDDREVLLYEKEISLTNYDKVLTRYNDYVDEVINSEKKRIDDLLCKSKEMVSLLCGLENYSALDETTQGNFFSEIVRDYVTLFKSENSTREDLIQKLSVQRAFQLIGDRETAKNLKSRNSTREDLIQKLSVQRTLQVIGDSKTAESLTERLDKDTINALIDLRNNYLSHLEERSHLFARVMVEYKSGSFNVANDLGRILYGNGKTSLTMVQNLNKELEELSSKDKELQKITGELHKLGASMKKGANSIVEESDADKVSELDKCFKNLRSSVKEIILKKIVAEDLRDLVNREIDEYFKDARHDDSARWKLYLGIPFFYKRLEMLKNEVLKDSYIGRKLREDFTCTVNQKPANKLALYLRRDENKKLQAGVELLIFDLRSILTDALKRSKIDFDKIIKDRLDRALGNLWLRNYLAHSAHGNRLCYQLTDLSEVIASDAQMFIDKGELIVAFKELSFGIKKDGKNWSKDSKSKDLFRKLVESSYRVEFLQMLSEVIQVELLESGTEQFLTGLSDNQLKFIFTTSDQRVELLKLLKEIMVSDEALLLLKRKVKLFLGSSRNLEELLIILGQEKAFLNVLTNITGLKALVKEVERKLKKVRDHQLKQILVKAEERTEFMQVLIEIIKQDLQIPEKIQIKSTVTNVLKKLTPVEFSELNPRYRMILKEFLNLQENFTLEELFNALSVSNNTPQAYENHQETFSCLYEYINDNIPFIEIREVEQGLYLFSFKVRDMKFNGKCAAITRHFSQSMFLKDSSLKPHMLLLNNLKTSAEVYERIAQGKQVSLREEREIFALSNLLDSFEQQLGYSRSSLPSSLSYIQSYKTLSDLLTYITELSGNFALHLVTNNHVVAIYRVGDNYAYFDTNVAFISGMRTIQELMKVVENAVKLAGYELAKEGFLVEHCDVAKANSQLSNEDKQILSKEIRTERQLLAEQDKEFGLIKVNGRELSRVQLYDFGTKINVEGSVPLLLNADMSLNSKNLSDYLNTGKISMTAREYIDNLKNSKNIKEVVQATRSIPFIGSRSEIDKAEQTRKFTLFKLLLELYNKCFFTALHSISAFISTSNRDVYQRESHLSETTSAIESKPVTYLTDLKVDNQLEKSLSSF